jgi:NAD+ synthase
MSQGLDVTSRRIRLADPQQQVDRLAELVRSSVRGLRLQGAVIAVSGGVDSAACLALAAHSLGARRCLGLFLPDRHSGPESLPLAQEVCDRSGVPLEIIDITPALDSLGCYRAQNAAVAARVPDFDPATDRFRVDFRQDFTDPQSLPNFGLTVVRPGDSAERHSLSGPAYLQLIAATNMKQRIRMLLTHHHAEARNYAVIGTSNRLEIEQGFFVRYGDGTGDVLPLRHLLKTQVYQLGAALGVPESVLRREPTTDTYSAPQSQEEFFYGLPRELNDVMWDAFAAEDPVEAVAAEVGRTPSWVEAVYAAFARRRALAVRLSADALNPLSADALNPAT